MQSKDIEITRKEIEELIKDDSIVLPKFQRGFIWEKKKIKKLAKSIKSNYPIGNLIVFRQPNIDTSLSDNKNRYMNLLIDGQQRVTAIKKIVKKYENFIKECECDNNECEKCKINKEGLEKIKKYKVIITSWNQENKPNLIEWFKNANQNIVELDEEDIHLAFLSEKPFDEPSWFEGEERKKIDTFWEKKNTEIKTFTISTPNKISILELIYYISDEIEISINKDNYIFANLIKSKNDKNYKKEQLVYAKKILACIFAEKKEEALTKNHEKHFDKKITSWLKNIFEKGKNSKEKKDNFTKIKRKLIHILKTFHLKFSFTQIPTSKSLAERKNCFNKAKSNKYLAIYLLDFIKKNKNLIINSQIKLEDFKKEYDKFKISYLDLINFIISKPITSGGKEKWIDIIFDENSPMYYDHKESIDLFIGNLFKESASNKEKKNTSILTLFWIFDKDFKYKLDNKKNWYEIDHSIPKKYLKTIENKSSLENLSPLDKETNQDKSSSIGKYFNEDWVNKKIKEKDIEIYKKIKQIVEKWKISNEIKNSDFDKYLKLRQDGLKMIMQDKILKILNNRY